MTKILLLLSGGKDSLKIYEEYIARGIDFECLQFISETIPALQTTHRSITHIYIPSLSSSTKAKARLKKQDDQMLLATLGFAKGMGATTIAIGLKDSDFDEDYLKGWVKGFVERAEDLAVMNQMNLVFPLINPEGSAGADQKK